MSRLTNKNKGKYYPNMNNIVQQKNYDAPNYRALIHEKLGKLEDLEEELGCPLEVVFKVLKGEKILFKNEEYYGSLRWNFYTNGFVFDLNTNTEITNFYLKTNDYGKEWWLKGEKDE